MFLENHNQASIIGLAIEGLQEKLIADSNKITALFYKLILEFLSYAFAK